MGFGVTELLIILAIVLVLFGAKKLRNIGGDLGGAIKNFKSAMNEDEEKSITDTKTTDSIESKTTDSTIEGKVENKTKESV
jgi:sec-independent protein translocase protein TatA